MKLSIIRTLGIASFLFATTNLIAQVTTQWGPD